MEGTVEGHRVLVGRTRLMGKEGIDLQEAKQFLEKCEKRGDSRACVAINGQLAGIISYRNQIREDAISISLKLKHWVSISML